MKENAHLDHIEVRNGVSPCPYVCHFFLVDVSPSFVILAQVNQPLKVVCSGRPYDSDIHTLEFFSPKQPNTYIRQTPDVTERSKSKRTSQTAVKTPTVQRCTRSICSRPHQCTEFTYKNSTLFTRSRLAPKIHGHPHDLATSLPAPAPVPAYQRQPVRRT